ncbi:MAG: hypothetical protein IJV56_10995, partial [Neisseriaceae bacterium]|nr:hypothetical protein [Neisseriaceae bacterium]
ALSKLKGKRIKNVGIVPRSGDLVFCTKKHAITLSADTQGLIQVKKQKLKKFMKNKMAQNIHIEPTDNRLPQE